jgi:hypothetical protein
MLSGQKVLTHDCAVEPNRRNQLACSPGARRRRGECASMRFLEFFAANIRNPHTRRAY